MGEGEEEDEEGGMGKEEEEGGKMEGREERLRKERRRREGVQDELQYIPNHAFSLPSSSLPPHPKKGYSDIVKHTISNAI